MKKSVKKILASCILVIFCSVFMSNLLTVHNAYAEETSGSESSTVITTTTTSSKASTITGTTKGYTAPVGGTYCQSTTNVFQTIACKIVTTLDDLRMIIYVIAGFGLIAFAFSAIFGKISWKHLAQIAFGLFLVSMMAPFISYFTGPGGGYAYYKMPYGDYLPYGDFTKDFALVEGKGTSTTASEDCIDANKATTTNMTNSGGLCLDEVVVEGKSPTASSWSLKDLKGTVQSAIKTAQAVHSGIQATKSAVKEVKAQVTLVSGAIKNSGGGVNGLLNIAGTVSNAGAMLGQTGYTLGNNLQYNAATAANSYQDAFLTNEQRAENEKLRASGQQTNSIAAQVTDKQSGIVKKGENYYDAKGNKVVVSLNESGQFVNTTTGEVLGDKVDSSGNVVTASKFTNIVDQAEKGREYGMKGGAALTSASNDSQNMNNMVGGIGGSALGNLAGLVTLGASATGNIVDMNSQVQANETAKKEAQVSKTASASSVLTNTTDKSGNTTIKYSDGTMELRNKDGSSSVSYANGTVVTKTSGGLTTTTAKDGSSKTVNPNGTVSVKNSDGTGVITYKDGTSKKFEADGTYVTVDKTGKVTGSYDATGNAVVATDAVDAALKKAGDESLAKMQAQDAVLTEIKRQNGGTIPLNQETIDKMRAAGFDVSKYEEMLNK
ncbi:MAG: TrbC/VirB2 family protein [Alphaproteobacteria bacterium]